MIQSIDFAAAKQILDTQPGSVLLDVRTEEEYEWEHADGAHLLCLDVIDESSAAEVLPDKEAPVIVYCRSGNRSALACKRLARLGYETLYDLGGLNGWPYGMNNGLEP